MALHDDFQLTHHKHTGNCLPHYHTSYPVLILLTLLMGLFMIAVSYITLAGPPQTQSGTIQLSGLVPGVPPPSAPTMEAPVANQRFSSLPITVQGSCISTYTVVVERNGVAVGSVICNASDRYQLQIDLLSGSNSLTVRQYDLLSQSSPVSPAVVVFYDAPQAAVPATPKKKPSVKPAEPSVIIPQLIITTSYVNKPVFPGTKINLPIQVTGGTSPFAISVDWGDGSSDLISREANGMFSATHSYDKPGEYAVKISAIDKAGQKAYTQSAVTVNGIVPPVTGVTDPGGNLLIAWPIYVVMCALIFGFWLGERYDANRWRHHHPAI